MLKNVANTGETTLQEPDYATVKPGSHGRASIQAKSGAVGIGYGYRPNSMNSSLMGVYICRPAGGRQS
jgi:hypothetical protein